MTQYVTAFVNPYSEAQENRARYLDGLTLVPDTILCPRIVAGQECRGSACLCADHKMRVFDHGRMWRDRDGNLVLTGEPYGISGQEVANLNSDVQHLGLEVMIYGRSYWKPGDTLRIVIKKVKKEAERRTCVGKEAPGRPCLRDVKITTEGDIALCDQHAQAVSELHNLG